MGLLLSLVTSLLGATALAIWAHGSAARETRHRRAVVALLGRMAILAFVLSAISTYDDDFQLQYVSSPKTLRASCRGLTRVSVNTIRLDMALHQLVAQPKFPQPERGLLSTATIPLLGRLRSAACANRAPPFPL
jgi:hypothetical protein